MKTPPKIQQAEAADPAFELIVAAFAGDPQVTHADGKGFGSGALKVNGKIFAMKSSRDLFVVKLPKQRVDELVASGQGERFDPGHGRLMKQWISMPHGQTNWLRLAKEAYTFVKGGSTNQIG